MSKINDLIKELCPNGVLYQTIRDVCDFQNGYAFKSNLFKDDGEILLRITNIDGKKLDLFDVKYINISDYNTDLSSFKVNYDDIVIAMSGATTGKIGINHTNKILYLNQRVGKITPKDSSLNNHFLYHYLLSKVNYFYQLAGGGAQPNLSSEAIKNTLIPIPPLIVQEEIVRILDKFGELEAELEAELEVELEARKSQYEFWREKIINNDNNNVVELGDVCKIVGRIGFRGYTRNDLVDSKEDGAISLSPGNIKNNNLNYDDPTYVSWEKYKESPEIMIDNNDIIFCKTGSTVGKVALVQNLPHKATINPQLVVLKELKCNPSYLSYIMGSNYFQSEVMRIKGLGSIPTISQKDLAKLKISLPSRAEQDKIAIILDKFNTLINDISVGITSEIELRRQQYEYYRNKLLSFEELSVGE